VIARSYDAKPFVKMGAPYYQIKDLLRRERIMAFSSNYALYGQMSERVMTLIESMVPASEVYSIDEAFVDLIGVPGDLDTLGRAIRSKVYRCTGIPVGVRIARTKTLAKLANHTAKRLQTHTGGVVACAIPSSVIRYCAIQPSRRCGESAGGSTRIWKPWASRQPWTWPKPTRAPCA
jgi:DNA polymerase V